MKLQESVVFIVRGLILAGIIFVAGKIVSVDQRLAIVEFRVTELTARNGSSNEK